MSDLFLYYFYNSDISPIWDDTSKNNSQVGDYFSFVNNKKKNMEIFKIIGILNSNLRDSNWDIKGHNKRRVLVLSKKLYDINLYDYLKEFNYSSNWKSQGTQRSNIKY